MAFVFESLATRVRQYLEHQARRVPGIQYVMTRAEGVAFEFCAGWRDLAGLPMTAETTCVYPDHPYGTGVTIRRLLNHTAGVPSPMPINWLHLIDDGTFDEDKALAAVMRAHPRPSFPAGDRYAYSNLSYWLLGKVIERVSGLRCDDYFGRELFARLGTTAGELSFAVGDTELFARGYQRKYSMMGLFTRLAARGEFVDDTSGPWLRFSRVCMNGPPYGGIIGTARGFCRFLQDQLQPQSILFRAEEKVLFFSPQRDARSREVPTTLGWHRGKLSGVPYFGKPGGGPGFHGNIRLYPERGIATAWFVNEMEVSERRINQFADGVDRHWLSE